MPGLIPSNSSRSLRLSPRLGAGRHRLLTRCVIVVAAILTPTFVARAQQVDSTPRLGLGASSAVSVHGGFGKFKHASLGPEFGAALDLGWIGSPRVRLSVGVDYLSTTIDRPDSLGFPQHGTGYVFTAFADVTTLMPITRHLTPYGGVGFGVDAVGTEIANPHIGRIYNTNVLDLHAQVGTLVRLSPSGRLQIEGRATGARVVRRFGVRIGYSWVFNTLRERN